MHHPYSRAESSGCVVNRECDLIIFAYDISACVQIESRDNSAGAADLERSLALSRGKTEEAEGRTDACDSLETSLMKFTCVG
jgi:hypothetical protein